MNNLILGLDVIIQVVPVSLVVPGRINYGGRRSLLLLTQGVLSHHGIPCTYYLLVAHEVCVTTVFPLTVYIYTIKYTYIDHVHVTDR